MNASPIPHLLLPPGSKLPPRISNLAFALLCLPPDTRRDMLVFYQFCRVVDDIADDPLLAAEAKRSQLASWREALAGRRDLPCDLAAVLAKHAVKTDYLEAILDGVSSDVTPAPFPDFATLSAYCWKVAVAVGLASNQITGCKDPASEHYALHLGTALQLTNILRDVGEDAHAGRIYFPEDWMRSAGENRQEWLQGQPGKGFVVLWKRLAEIANEHFAAVQAGPPRQDTQALRAADLMREIYHCLLEKMARNPSGVWKKRFRLSPLRKGFLLTKALLCAPRFAPLGVTKL